MTLIIVNSISRFLFLSFRDLVLLLCKIIYCKISFKSSLKFRELINTLKLRFKIYNYYNSLTECYILITSYSTFRIKITIVFNLNIYYFPKLSKRVEINLLF